MTNPADQPNNIEQQDAVSSDNQDTSADELSFAQMLEQHEREEQPQSRLSPGQRVSVRIVAITTDTVFVSTGSKVDGIVDKEELLVDGEFPYNVDDSLDLYVVTVNPQEVKLSKIIRGAGSLSALEDAKYAGLPIEGKVTAQVKGGYAIDVMKRRAFCPASQMALRPLEDAESVVGKVFPFIITKLESGGRNIVVSHRVLLEREQNESRDALLATINDGDVVEATITRTAPFGAFAELAPNVEGLIHLSELAWARVGQADEAVTVGDKVRVKVLGIEKTEKATKISLSMRQVTEDPWNTVGTRLQVGEAVAGKVVRTAPFGAFVEVLPGIEGLVHISELSYERKVHKTEDVLVAGDHVTVKIKELDLEKRRLSLSLRDVAGNPWTTAESDFVIGAEVTGTMERRAPFGFFIAIAPGITGLLPNSTLHGNNRKVFDKLGAGDPIAVIVKEIDVANHRISLGPVGEEGAEDAREEKDWKRHAPKPAPAATFGSLGLAFQAAADKKKKK